MLLTWLVVVYRYVQSRSPLLKTVAGRHFDRVDVGGGGGSAAAGELVAAAEFSRAASSVGVGPGLPRRP